MTYGWRKSIFPAGGIVGGGSIQMMVSNHAPADIPIYIYSGAPHNRDRSIIFVHARKSKQKKGKQRLLAITPSYKTCKNAGQENSRVRLHSSRENHDKQVGRHRLKWRR